MTTFEKRFLRLRTIGFASQDFLLSSGPKRILEPFSSVEVGSIEEYSAKEFASTVSALPGVSVVRQAEFETVWRWGRQGRSIETCLTADNIGEGDVWLASLLSLDCTFGDLVEFWWKLSESYPAIYLHAPSCRMYRPCSFLEEIAIPALAPAFQETKRTFRERAIQEFHHYHSLARKPRRFKPYWREMTPHMKKTLFDLPPPVAQIKCKDFWQGDNWSLQMKLFDKEAHARRLAYFAYPSEEWVEGKFKSGFMVWASSDQIELAKEVAKGLDVLAAET